MRTELSQAAKDARKRYLREWKRRNPDKVAATMARYYERLAKRYAQEGDEQKEDDENKKSAQSVGGNHKQGVDGGHG